MNKSIKDLEKDIIGCQRCQRLVAWREEVGVVKRRAFCDQTYWAKPVPGFGDVNAEVLVVGLAPGAHGSNRTGRMFTGDASGDFLYPALYRAGFTNLSHAFGVDDGLRLQSIYITAVCRCAPPENKPKPDEMRNCRDFLENEIKLLTRLQGIVALGKIAYDSMVRLLHLTGFTGDFPSFSHGTFFAGQTDSPWLLGSYHPSRQNTQTGRLTEKMFDEIWKKVNSLLVR